MADIVTDGKAVPIPPEVARIEALRQLRLLDTPANESFDRVTRMASQLFNLPIAAVSLTDSDRQWFKSRVGIDHQTIPRDKAPCAEVAETRDVLVIPDFLDDPWYRTSLLARSGIRFYAGAPLVTRDGYGLGSLCVLGNEPRDVTPQEIAALVDMAAIVMAQIELEHAFGRTDPVSAMPNKNQFIEDLSDLARDQVGQSRIAVVVDLARQDQVDTIARVVGVARIDDMVREAGQALCAVLHRDQIAYHVGTTQFAFLSRPDADQDSYIGRLEATLTRVQGQSTVRFVTTVAVGAMPFRLGDVSAHDVLRGAHGAAQDARAAGRAVALYSLTNDDRHGRQFRLLHDFGLALAADDQLRLVVQPRIDLTSGRCVGGEALLRWTHPVMGEIGPAEFIPIIEHTSLARTTTQWVLDAALRELSAWSALGFDLRLSINVSAANLTEDDFAKRVELALLRHRVRPAQLEIEITESAVMETPELALAMLEKLAAADIVLAIDDFGTGHSSLAYLQRLPVQVVKIDQAFIRNLSDAASADHALVETILVLSHRLGHRVVAEGVETREAADLLRQAGCEEAQGYFFARPIEAGDFVAWLRAQDGAEPQTRVA
jgi:EAL domain-containing protein (putative c-di-GMP-specific phosphodiesterase class I)/GGDEF domain-containing protein